jgi:predicted ribosome quality control (RQC) complex YloA/Tae2 family protein
LGWSQDRIVNMFHHFLFVEKLARSLNEVLNGGRLSASYTQQKDELILSFESPQDFHIKADLRPISSLLYFPAQSSRAKRNSVDIFPEIIGQKVTSIQSHPYDRSFRIHLERRYSLIFKMYGRRSNVLLYKDDRQVAIFRTTLAQDKGITLADFDDVNPPDALQLEKILDEPTKSYLADQQITDPIEAINLLREKSVYLQTSPKLTIRHFSLDANEEVLDPIQCANEYYSIFNKSILFENEKAQLKQQYLHKKKQSESYIKKSSAKLDQIANRRSYKEIADLIMANLHILKAGMETVTLFDFYQNSDIEIKLKKNLSPSKNAEILYRKSKNEQVELQSIQRNIDDKKRRLNELFEVIEQIDFAADWRGLKSLNKQSKKEADDPILPYHSYQFAGYEIRVGKDAKRNDQLTTKHSSKDDIWLHAKDVSGSHVVIKNPTKKRPPSNVLEYAAQIAAYYSKRKSDKLCPVLFTQRKYVRKSKKLLPGQVIVEREEVLLVEPSNPNK